VENTISALLSHYERGKITRRELIQGLALLAVAGSPASAAGFKAGTINHVSIQVSDLQKSVDWYKKAFGLAELKTEEKNVVMLAVGPSHLSIRAGKQPGTIDHFAIGLDPFNEAAIVEDFKKRGYNPSGPHVKDPDGLNVQLSSLDGHA
jgi:catechol 2,3-dioxygenase-like lactoylglutathione lyase family enzyme